MARRIMRIIFFWIATALALAVIFILGALVVQGDSTVIEPLMIVIGGGLLGCVLMYGISPFTGWRRYTFREWLRLAKGGEWE